MPGIFVGWGGAEHLWKPTPNLKALMRKFGLSILPEMAVLIIGFQLAETQSITAAINHRAAITPLMHPQLSNVSFRAFSIRAHEGAAVQGGQSCACSSSETLRVGDSHPSALLGCWELSVLHLAACTAFRKEKSGRKVTQKNWSIKENSWLNQDLLKCSGCSDLKTQKLQKSCFLIYLFIF